METKVHFHSEYTPKRKKTQGEHALRLGKNSLVKEFLVNRHAEIMRNRAQIVVRDGLADFALTRGQHLDVDFRALLDGVR